MKSANGASSCQGLDFSPVEAQTFSPLKSKAGRRTFWIGILTTGIVCGGMYFYRLGYWPWDVDELSSLEEMGLLDPEIRQVVLDPDSIVVRLPRLVPVWYTVQKFLLRWLPQDEWGTRFLSAVCAAGAVMVLYGWGWQWRGTIFAASLVLLAGGSMLLVWLAQQNRFYTMAFLWLVLAELAIWAGSPHWGWWVGTAFFTLLAIFTHNVVIVLFGLQAGVVMVGWLFGGASGPVALRAGLAGLLAAGVYLLHVRPIAGSWTGAGLTWAPPWASFAAHVGVPTVVLALMGSAVACLVEKERRQMAVWAAITVSVLIFVLMVPQLMPIWNPRYSLLWVLPLWITGAMAVETVATGLLRWANPSSGQPTPERWKNSTQLPYWLLLVGWYGCVGLLLVPKWLSHWIDGTRHDYRQAAHLVVQWLQEDVFISRLPIWSQPSQVAGNLAPGHSPRRLSADGSSPKTSESLPAGASGPRSNLSRPIPILTNMELQMRYYLPQPFRSQCRYWAPGIPLPEGECLVVLGGNGWEGPLAIPDRMVEWIGLVGRRRFDELSHVIRIYWVGPPTAAQQSG
ncbi:MAG: hypothetical protein NZ602_15295 [Thermoguttaceae bacterium]|nr:hypothetical protein [Thermoguttaceae bacterium]MDW8039693.1 hypothetical protein [Thermoguttaceae bacterium]